MQFGFEDTVEVLGGADGDDGVGVCEGREDADSICQTSDLTSVPASFVYLEWKGNIDRGDGGGWRGKESHSFEFSNCARTAMAAGKGFRSGCVDVVLL